MTRQNIQEGQHRRERHWQAHINAQRKSGSSRTAYCKEHNLSYHAPTYWSRRFSLPEREQTNLVPVRFPSNIEINPAQTAHSELKVIRKWRTMPRRQFKSKIVIMWVSIFILLGVPSARAVTVINSLPFTASTEGETYELSGDLSSTTYGIYVTAHNVTIDLKGHTLTWGTGNGEDAHGIYTNWSRNGLTVYSSVEGGALVHGATTNPGGCSGIFGQELARDYEIHDFSITVNSRADDNITAGIILKRARDPQIYNMVVTNNASAVANRHSIPAAGIYVQLEDTTTDALIDNNAIFSRHWGVHIGGSSSGTDAVVISNNEIEIDQVAVNAYALAIRGGGGAVNTLVGGINIIDNTITTSGEGGRGITLEHLDYAKVYGNEITVGAQHIMDGETPVNHTNLLRIRYGTRYVQVYNNDITVLCGQSDYVGGKGISITTQDGIDNSNALGIDNIIRNNRIFVDNQSDEYTCIGVNFGNTPENSNLTFENNSITSNHVAVKFEPDANPDYTIADLYLDRTTITRTTPASGNSFYSWFFADTQSGRSDITVDINCTTYAGGARQNDTYESQTGFDLDVTYTELCRETSSVLKFITSVLMPQNHHRRQALDEKQ